MGVCRGALVVGVLPALLFAQPRIQSLGGLALHFSQVEQSKIPVFSIVRWIKTRGIFTIWESFSEWLICLRVLGR